MPPLDVATIAAQGVRAPAPETLPEGERAVPSAEPIYQTSVFDFDSIEASDGPLGDRGGYAYARHGLPNARSLEAGLAALEGAEDALATSSGLGAIACALLACPEPPGAGARRILVQHDVYGGTLAMLRREFARFGFVTEEIDIYDVPAVGRALEPGALALLVETVSNPLLVVADLEALVRLCRARGVRLLVDNTFATPILTRPLGLGADLVIHSATKFLGGHHDLCAGVVAGPRGLIAEARLVARRLGLTAAPFDAWLACRGMRTLALRVERGQESARILAERLGRHRRIARVHYPGWGALVSFDVGSQAAASALVRALQLIPLVPSLGGTQSSLSHPATSSHRSLAPEERHARGIPDGLLRLSVGIEAVEDLWRDLEAALS